MMTDAAAVVPMTDGDSILLCQAQARDLPPLLDDAAAGPVAALGDRDAAREDAIGGSRIAP
jgi:hypothetical protein